MSLLSAPPIACPTDQAVGGLPAVPQTQDLDEHFAQVLARKLNAHTDADADTDMPEQIALNVALILPQDGELDAVTMGDSAAHQIAGEPWRADDTRAGTVDARAALDRNIAQATQAARAALTPAAALRARADTTRPDASTDAIVLDARLVPDETDSRNVSGAVGNVLQQIQTAKALKSAPKAQAAGGVAEAPGAVTKAAATQDAQLPGDTRTMMPVQAAQAPLAANAHDTLASALALNLAGNPASAASTTPPPTAAISVALSHPQWAHALGQQVLHLARASTHEPQIAHLRLDPPELGPLRIAISLHDQVVQANFVSAHAPVRLAVETALTQLQEQLADAGLSLGQTSVSDQGAAREDSSEHAPPRATFALPFTPAPLTHEASASPARAPHALIDTFV